MFFIRPPYLLKKVYPQALWRVITAEKKIYLTFDDGPIKEVTPLVLDLLNKYNIKGTFFCVGNNVAQNQSIYKRIISEGHRVGNHTFNHMNGWEHGSKAYIQDVITCSDLVETNLFRPPYGKIRTKQAETISKKYKIVLWDVLSGDFDQTISGEQCYQNVIKHTRPGSIIVFHDSLKAANNMLYALPKCIEHFLKEGYTFVTL